MPTETLAACPKCHFSVEEASTSCERCGLIFARYRDREQAAELAAATLREQVVNPADVLAGIAAAPVSGTLDRRARHTLAIGSCVGLALYVLPPTRFLLRYLATLVHELGHAAVGWLFGYPSIPAFDFVYGGGVTMLDERNVGILLLVYAGVALLAAWFWRRSAQVALALLALLVAIYTAAAFTRGHEILFLAAGHASELAFAGIFLYRGLSGSACRTPGERPLYAAVSSFLLLNAAGFAWLLMTDQGFRVDYEQAKGGGSWMDFSRLAEEFLGTDLSTVAVAFLLTTIATPFLAWIFLRGRGALERALVALLGGATESTSG